MSFFLDQIDNDCQEISYRLADILQTVNHLDFFLDYQQKLQDYHKGED